MRQLWNTKKGHYHHGTIKDPEKLKSSGIKRLMEDALWTQGIRKRSNLKRNRYEFQTDHGFRKWFKTRCEISGMKSINIEILMGHSIGISDSYYKITEKEILDNYLEAEKYLIISSKNQLQNNIENMVLENDKNSTIIKEKIFQKEQRIHVLETKEKFNEDVITSLSDQLLRITGELEKLKSQINLK